MNKYLTEKLKEGRLNKGLKQSDVTALIGIKNTTLSNYENGVTEPDMDTFLALCQLYELDYAEILGEAYGWKIPGLPFNIKQSDINLIKKYHDLDAPGRDAVDYILSHETDRAKQIDTLREPLAQYGQKVLKVPYGGMNAAAGNFIDWVDAITDTIECEENASSRHADFAVGVSGDSMEPTYSDRDIVLVKRNTQIAVGKIGVFYLEAENELYIKELGNGELISHNPNYPPIRSTNGFSCIGEVLGKAVLV